MEKTALYNFHKNLGAKFVPFAGYEMPVQYSSGIVRDAITFQEYIVVAGGFELTGMHPISDVVILNLSTMEWEEGELL